MEEFKSTYKPFFDYFKEKTDPKDIEVTHPGILDVPEDKNINEMPLEHFVKIAKSKGLSAVTKALMNLVRWNKDRNPKLSQWAKDTQEKVSKAMEKKESMEKHERYKRYFEKTDKIFLKEYFTDLIQSINRIRSNNIQGIIRELYNLDGVNSLIRNYNLRGGDFVESVASTLFYSGSFTDDDLNDSINSSK